MEMEYWKGKIKRESRIRRAWKREVTEVGERVRQGKKIKIKLKGQGVGKKWLTQIGDRGRMRRNG